MDPTDASTHDALQRRARRRRAFVAVAWLTLVAGLLFGGFFRGLTVESAAALVRGAGLWGVFGYLAAFTLLQPSGLSGHLLIVAAALVWDWWVAMPLALLGAVGSATTCYLFARYVAFDWVQARLPEWLRKYESRLVQRGLWGVVIFRILTFTMQPAMLMMGTLRVRLPTMLVGTLIGFAPQVCVDVLLGGEVMRYLFDALGLS